MLFRSNSGQRGYREDLESALQGKPGGWGRCSCEATPAFPAAATCFGRLRQTGRLCLSMEAVCPAWRLTRGEQGGGTRHNDGVPPLAGHGFLSVRSIEGERGRVGEWVSGRGGEWVRDTKRSQTQSVSPRKPPPLAGHTLPVV